MSFTQLELYGITDGIDAATLQKLQNGFAGIRAYTGWETFRIPEYVWDYVDQTARDSILSGLYNTIYVVRETDAIQHDMWFAYSYTLSLFTAWYMCSPIKKRPTGIELYLALQNDVGIPYQQPTASVGFSDTQKTLESSGNLGITNIYAYINPPWNEGRYSSYGGYFDSSVAISNYYRYTQVRFYMETGVTYDYFEFRFYDSPDLEIEIYNRTGSNYTHNYLENITTSTPADWGSTYTFQDYWWNNVINNPPGSMSILEKYGATYEMNETYLEYLTKGLDLIRQREGWEYLRIPEDVWTYIGQAERDRILDFLYHQLYEKRVVDDYYSKDEMPLDINFVHQVFAFRYIGFLFSEWFRDNLTKQYEYWDNLLSFYRQELLNRWGFKVTFDNVSSSWNSYDEVYPSYAIYFYEPYYSPSDQQNWNCGFELYYEMQDSSSMQSEDPLYFYSFNIFGIHYAGSALNTDLSNAKMEIDCDTDLNNPDWNLMMDYAFPEDDVLGSEYSTWGENWNDRGIEETWTRLLSAINNGFYVNDNIPVLDGQITFNSFGSMEGSVLLSRPIVEGKSITVQWFKNNEAQYTVATGVVSNTAYDLATNSYKVYFSDPVTAGGGQAIYSSGYAIYALRDAIQYYGGAVEIDVALIPAEDFPDSSIDSSWLSENITVYWNEDENPPDFWQFARNVCYALNAVLYYGRDGKYYIKALPASHTLSSSDVLSDDSPNIINKPQDYANEVIATIDDTYYTVATEYTYDYYSAGGATVSIKKLGERLEWVKTDLGDGEAEERYYYDANGYLTRKVEEYEDGSTKHYKETVWKNIQDENRYDLEITTRVWAYESWWENDSIQTGWIEQNRTVVNWNVNLLGSSTFEKVVYSVDPPTGSKINTTGSGGEYVTYEIGFAEEDWHDWPYLWPKEKWKGTMVTNPEANFLNGFSTAEHYTYGVVGLYVPLGSSFPAAKLGWRKAYDGSTGGISHPVPLEKYEAEDAHEVHLRAEARDQQSIDTLGTFSYEATAIALNSEEGIKNFALNILREKARIRHCTLSTFLNSGINPHDTVTCFGQDWYVDTLYIDLGNYCETLNISGKSSLLKLKGALPKEPVTVLDDFKNVINSKTKQYHNVARGKILSRRGKNRYTVKLENEANEVVAKSIGDAPLAINSTVLLSRPTGKRNKWFIHGYSNEEEILIQTAEEEVTPALDASYGIANFAADTYNTTVLDEVTLSWEYVFDPDTITDYGVTIDPGDGSATFDVTGGATNTTIRLGTIGEITPTISFWAMLGGEKTISDPVPLNRPIGVYEPSWTDIFTYPRAISLGKSYDLDIQVDSRVYDYLPDFYVGVNHGDGTGDQDGYFYYPIDENGQYSYSHTWNVSPETLTISIKVQFTQADGTTYENVVDQKTYYNFPIGGEVNFAASSVVTNYGKDFFPTWGTNIRLIDDEYIGYGGVNVDWELSFKIAAGTAYGAPDNLYDYDVAYVLLHTGKKYRPEQFGETYYGNILEGYLAVSVDVRTSSVILCVEAIKLIYDYGYISYYYRSKSETIIETIPSSISPTTVKVVQPAGGYLEAYWGGIKVFDFTPESAWDVDYKKIYPHLSWYSEITNPVYGEEKTRSFRQISALTAVTYYTVINELTGETRRRYVDKKEYPDGTDHYCGFIPPYDIQFKVFPTLVREDEVGEYNMPGSEKEFYWKA